VSNIVDVEKLKPRVVWLANRYQIDIECLDSPAWTKAIRSQRRAIVKIIIKRLIAPWRGITPHRGQQEIQRIYDIQWRKKPFERYMPKIETAGAPWEWGRGKWLMSNEAGAAFRLIYLDEVIQTLAPESVLEIGCGNGINLLTLSAKYPGVEFSGLELTQGGVDAAASVIEKKSLPEALTKFAPFDLCDLSAPSRVKVCQGSAIELPYANASFDLVMTSLALEQMEDLRDAAMREIVRVAKRWVVMLEPFHEVNKAGWRRRYVRAYDYFQGAIADLPQYGLHVEQIVSDMPHKSILGTALVISQKMNG
jgi:ubiquinone/menaquinone biosynthesis C-methylase UbiE